MAITTASQQLPEASRLCLCSKAQTVSVSIAQFHTQLSCCTTCRLNGCRYHSVWGPSSGPAGQKSWCACFGVSSQRRLHLLFCSSGRCPVLVSSSTQRLGSITPSIIITLQVSTVRQHFCRQSFIHPSVHPFIHPSIHPPLHSLHNYIHAIL